METNRTNPALDVLAESAVAALNAKRAEVDDCFRVDHGGWSSYFLNVPGDIVWVFTYDQDKGAVTKARRSGIAPYPMIALERDWNGYHLVKCWEGEEDRN